MHNNHSAELWTVYMIINHYKIQKHNSRLVALQL